MRLSTDLVGTKNGNSIDAKSAGKKDLGKKSTHSRKQELGIRARLHSLYPEVNKNSVDNKMDGVFH